MEINHNIMQELHLMLGKYGYNQGEQLYGIMRKHQEYGVMLNLYQVHLHGYILIKGLEHLHVQLEGIL